MTKVFLSYDRDDRTLAQKVAAALERAGHDVWWDRNIRGGAEFSQEIDQALQAAEAVVVLWSERSIASAWVRDEAAAGRDSGRLIPVRIDQCMPPLGFRQYHSIDLQTGRKGLGNFTDLDQAVRALAGGGSSPEIPARSTAGGGSVTRRRMMIGAGAAAAGAGAGGFFLYRKNKREEAPPEVAPLMVQAKQLMNQNTREGQYQGIGLYERVVRLAPRYADGWGWLGYAYGVVSHYRERKESLALRAKAQAAGHRALELDPDSAFGEVALSVALPFIGHWAERERRLQRALSLTNDDEILVMMGVALQFAGRSTEAIPFYQRIKHKPLTPAEYTNFIRGLWSAGRLPELDEAVRDASSLYPTQGSIWFSRLDIAAYAGDVGAVRALTARDDLRPSGVDDRQAEGLMKLVRAVRSRDPRDIDAVMASENAAGRVSQGQAEGSIRTASALGRMDDAFTLANAYYFGRGFIIPDTPNGTSFSPEQRQTRFLFEPVTRPMRADARFEPLVTQLGFDRYWRQSGKPPDYRHIPGL